MTTDDALKKKTVANISFSAISVVATNLAQFVTSIFLARMLVASDYGVAGYAQILITFMMQFADFGLNTALIQRKEIDERTLYTGFCLKLILSLGVMLVVLASSPFFGLVLKDQNIAKVVSILSLNFLLSVFSFLPQVILSRDLKYQKLVVPQTLGVTVGAAVSIVLAYKGYGFWSLVFGNLINNLLVAILLNVLHPSRYSIRFDTEVCAELAKFGWHMVLPGTIVFLIMNIDNFIVGSVKGAVALGYYNIAFNWGGMICIILAGIVHKVLLPTFSRLQHDTHEMKKWYLTSVKYIALIAIPVNIGLFMLSREFLVFVLGKGTERWIPALPALKVLCVYGIARALLEPVGNVIVGIGKPRLLFKATCVAVIVEIIGVFLALFYTSNLVWVATAVLTGYLTQYAIYYPIMKKEISLAGKEVAQAVFPAVVAVFCMVVGLVLARSAVPFSIAGMLVQIVLGIILYAIAYGVCDVGRVYGEMSRLVFKR